MRARLVEGKDLSILPIDELKQLVEKDPVSKDGLLAKIEIKRRNDVNGKEDE